MTKIFVTVLGFIISIFLIYVYFTNASKEKITQPPPVEELTQTSKKTADQNIEESNGIFVPYWSIEENLEVVSYDELYYFGVAVDDRGINTNEAGFAALPQFAVSIPSDVRTFLTIRMLNFDTNSTVLKNHKLQETIINESIDLAKEYNFSGILLDFEMNGLAFDSFIASISSFYNKWFTIVKQNNLTFYITLYGDVFYRVRPYDVSYLAKNTDKILIMSYDFHKARGNPGPNFPLGGKNIYGYDLNQMITDFTEVVPSEKLTVVFGLFGYDWEVSESKASISIGKPLSYFQIKDRFLNTCLYNLCKIIPDKVSAETSIEYSNKGINHVVWFEDEVSVMAKKTFLKEQGINSFGHWAYSYF